MRFAMFLAAAGVTLALCSGANAQAVGRSHAASSPSGGSPSTTPGGGGGGGGSGSPPSSGGSSPSPIVTPASVFGPVSGGCGTSGGTGSGSINTGNKSGNTSQSVGGNGNCNTFVNQELTQILKEIGNIDVNTNGGASLIEINQ